MLKFNTNTWHYKAFKFWHEEVKGKNYSPYKTNLCAYTHAVFFGCMMLVLCYTVMGAGCCIGSLFWPFFALCGLLTGWKPYAIDPSDWKPYKPFLTMFGKPVHLAQIIAPLATVCLAIFVFVDLPVSMEPALFSMEPALFFCAFVFVMAIPVFFTWILCIASSKSIAEYSKTDYYFVTENVVKEPNLFAEILKAKKEKICPLVEFNDVD